MCSAMRGRRARTHRLHKRDFLISKPEFGDVMRMGLAIIWISLIVVGIDMGIIPQTEAQKDTLTSGSPVDEETAYVNSSDIAWHQYSEDLFASSVVLNDFVQKNITRREAMTETMGIYLLSFQAVSQLNQLKPPERYSTYHNYTILSMTGLQWYLWNMAKFYETGNSGYAMVARDNFNSTKSWRDKALEERDMFLS